VSAEPDTTRAAPSQDQILSACALIKSGTSQATNCANKIVNKGVTASTALTLEASQWCKASAKAPYATTVFRQQKINKPQCKAVIVCKGEKSDIGIKATVPAT